MTRLLKSDFYKLTKMKSFFACALVLLVMGVGVVFLLDFTSNVVEGANIDTSQEGAQALEMLTSKDAAKAFPNSLGSDGVLFTAIVASILVACEFGFGTIKNTASRGFGRSRIYLSKLVYACGIAVFFSLLFCAAYTITSIALWGPGQMDAAFWQNAAGMLGLNLLLNCAFASLFTMVSSLIRQTGGAIAINICVMSFAAMLLNVLQMLIEKVFHLNLSFRFTEYTISSNMTAITQNPLTTDLVMRALFVGLAFILVTSAVGLTFFRKRDIK